MSKSQWVIICFVLFFFETMVIAQPNFSFKQSGQSSGSLPTTINIISSDDFANQVSQMNSKKEAEFKQQLNQQLSQVPKTSGSGLQVQPANVNQPGVTPSTPYSVTPATSTAPQSTVQPMTTSPYTGTTQQAQPAYVAPTPPPPAQMPQAAPQQIYTGFPTQPQSRQPTGNVQQQQPKSGGWNIKY